MMTIEEKLEALNKIISDAKLMIESLKDECKHPNYVAKYGSHLGIDRELDEYWVTLICPECGYREDFHHDIESQESIYYAKHERVVS